MKTENILIRYSNPTKYDLAPLGTLWKVCVGQEESYYYVQVGKEKDVSEWRIMGDFLEKAFAPFFGDDHPQSEKFIKHALNLYFNQSKNDPISAIIVCNLTK